MNRGQGREWGRRENRWALHAPFRRVMKRPASDMMRESNCACTRGHLSSVLSSSSRALVFGTIPHSWFSRETERETKKETERERERCIYLWTTVIYSNFILGAFGILEGQSTLFSGASPFVQRLIAPAALVSRGISRRDARKILARTLMIGDKTRGNFAAPLIRSVAWQDERGSPRKTTISEKDLRTFAIIVRHIHGNRFTSDTFLEYY